MPTLPWTVAKNDGPATDADVVVMASRLELKSVWAAPAFLVAALRIRKQMLAAPGAYGHSLIAKPLRRTFWTLSAWRGQSEMDAAVVGEPHASIIKHWRTKMAGSVFTTWTVTGADIPMNWPEALRRLTETEAQH